MDIKNLNQVRATYFDIENEEEVDEEYMHDKPIFSENTNNLIDNELDKENSGDLKEKEELNLSEEKKIDLPKWEEYKNKVSPGEKTFLECFIRDIELSSEGFYLIVDEKFSERVIKENYLNKINLFFEKKYNQKIDVCLRL
jgi:hypothetical protein